MWRKIVWSSLIVLAAGAFVAAVSVASGPDDTVGIGFLDVADLQVPSSRGQFAGTGVQMQGRLALHANGCVTVVLDGVERMPLWPDGTDVFQDPKDLSRYVVNLPGDVTLDVDDVSADRFSAVGVIDKADATFAMQAERLPEKVSSFIAYCGVEAAPVAFPDAATFVLRGTS